MLLGNRINQSSVFFSTKWSWYFTTRGWTHFMPLIQLSMHLTECNPGHISKLRNFLARYSSVISPKTNCRHCFCWWHLYLFVFIMGENLDHSHGTSGTSLDPPVTFHINKIIKIIPGGLPTKRIPQGHCRLFLAGPHPHQLKKYKTYITSFYFEAFSNIIACYIFPQRRKWKETI